jgi:hypothetical protein
MYRNALVIYHHIRVLKVSVIPWFVCVYVLGRTDFLGSLPPHIPLTCVSFSCNKVIFEISFNIGSQYLNQFESDLKCAAPLPRKTICSFPVFSG